MVHHGKETSPSDEWHAQRAAAAKTIRILEVIREEMETAIESQAPLHYFLELSNLGAGTAECLTTILGKGPVRIRLHQGEALMVSTMVPTLWILTLNGRDSLIAARVPRYVELLCASTRSCLAGPEKTESPLEVVVNRILEAEKEALSEGSTRSLDLQKEGLTAPQANSLLAQLGKGPLNIEVAHSKQELSTWWLTSYQAIWAGEVKNQDGVVTQRQVAAGVLPPEGFAAENSLEADRSKLADFISILKTTLAA